jgi:superfamily II DNA or RNA helicase
MAHLHDERADALTAATALQAENERLREKIRLLEDQGALLSRPAQTLTLEVSSDSDVSETSGAERKLSLFAELFRGRQDIFATRWENSEGRSGYSPSLRQGAFRKKGTPPQATDYLPLTLDMLRSHLTGKLTVGVYPLLIDETCWFLAMDFDKKAWQQDALAVLEACESFDVPAALERSRSGQGAHLWIFFSRPVKAAAARNLGSQVLTKALERRYQIGLGSYDRLFPSQDTMPKGGFGNLIALPLQGNSRRDGNSVFVDSKFEPYADQWRFLSSIKKVAPEEVEEIGGKTSSAPRNRSSPSIGPGIDPAEMRRPWTLPPSRRRKETPIPEPLPLSVNAVLASRLFIEKGDLPSALIDRLHRLAAFQNPDFYRAQAMRLSTFDKPRFVDCAEDFPEHLALPRGCWFDAEQLLRNNRVSLIVSDRRSVGAPIAVEFLGELTEDQLAAVRELSKHEFGVLSAPTGFGKTVIGAWLVAQRSVNTLILVHRQHLVDQWRERLAAFLDLSPKAIGQFGGGRHRVTGVVDIALLQSLSRRGEVKDLVANYGQIIVDECHHVPAFNFERVLAEARARFVVGLTATPMRKDGHDPIITFQCGPIRLRIDAKEQAAARPFDHEVIVRTTDFRLPEDLAEPRIQKIYSQLVADDGRTRLIVDDVLRAVANGRSPIVLTERTEHLERISDLLAGKVAQLVVLRGGLTTKQRRRIADMLKDIPEEEPRVLLATGRYIGEGFDDSRLDTLFLAMPVSWRGTIQQYVGRLHRLHANKRVVRVYDYVDVHVLMLLQMLKRRIRGYEDVGYLVTYGP